MELFAASGPMLLYLVKLMAVLLPFFGPVLAHPLAFPSLLLEVRAILFLLLLYPLKLILFKVLVFHLRRLFVLPTVLTLLSLLGALLAGDTALASHRTAEGKTYVPLGNFTSPFGRLARRPKYIRAIRKL